VLTLVIFVGFTVHSNEENAVNLLLPTHFQEMPQKHTLPLFYLLLLFLHNKNKAGQLKKVYKNFKLSPSIDSEKKKYNTKIAKAT